MLCFPDLSSPFESEDLYGVVVTTRELATLSGSDGLSHDIACPISYCFLSRFPFFELHQAVILQILMLLHLKRVKALGRIAAAEGPGSGINMAAQKPLSSSSSSTSLSSPKTSPTTSSGSGKPLGPHQVPACVSLLKRLYDAEIPGRGAIFTVNSSKLLQPISFQRPMVSVLVAASSSNSNSNSSNNALSPTSPPSALASPSAAADFHLKPNQRESCLLLAAWTCKIGWCTLSAEDLVDILELLLTETSLIVIGSNLALVSAAVQSLIPLLQPLKWSGVFLPVLPSRMYEFLDAPVPLVAGCQIPPLPEQIRVRCIEAGIEENEIGQEEEEELNSNNVQKRRGSGAGQQGLAVKPPVKKPKPAPSVSAKSRASFSGADDDQAIWCPSQGKVSLSDKNRKHQTYFSCLPYLSHSYCCYSLAVLVCLFFFCFFFPHFSASSA